MKKNFIVYGKGKITIGKNVRIDNFVIFTSNNKKSKLIIEDNVHISSFCFINFNYNVIIKEFSGLSVGVRIFTESELRNEDNLFFNPTAEHKIKRKTIKGSVKIEKNSIIGSNAVLLPGVVIGKACIIGANSVVRKSTNDFSSYNGNPLRLIKKTVS